MSKIRDKDENSTEFGGDFLHRTINVKILVFILWQHGGAFFHGQGEFRVPELCLLPDDTKSHGWVGTHGCQVRIHGPHPMILRVVESTDSITRCMILPFHLRCQWGRMGEKGMGSVGSAFCVFGPATVVPEYWLSTHQRPPQSRAELVEIPTS